MMRVCHLNTCPVGVATQDPKLRAKYTGRPEDVVNFMTFIAMQVRELMAKLGFRTINEMIGCVDRLEPRKAITHWKAKGLDFSNILHAIDVDSSIGRYCQIQQDHGLDKSLDLTTLLEICKPAIERGEKVMAELPVRNVNRVVGTITGSELTKKWGAEGLPDDTIRINFKGSAGQTFGGFMPKGMSFFLEGDANDYLGKGLCGGKLVIYPPKKSTFVPEENIIVGNVAFYGATSGEAYIRGMAGERFCVRNSGVHTVVEAVGDHGCEYMTGGRVVVLGPTGRNFAAGMSGGVAYVLDEKGDFPQLVNAEMVGLEKLEDSAEIAELRTMIENHHAYTESSRAKQVLDSWEEMLPKFVKVMPRDYKRMLSNIKKAHDQGLTGEDAIMVAFEENCHDLSRVGGN
jgi:glutamate synthase (ferredoxin)